MIWKSQLWQKQEEKRSKKIPAAVWGGNRGGKRKSQRYWCCRDTGLKEGRDYQVRESSSHHFLS